MLITNAKTRLWTKSEFHRLAEGGFFGPEERVELIEGELVVIAPASPEHSEPIREGTRLLFTLSEIRMTFASNSPWTWAN